MCAPGNPDSEMQVQIGKLAATPKRRRGRPLVPPDSDLMGALYTLVDTLEKGWPLIGWELECIRNAPKLPSLDAVRKALEPIKDWSQNYVFLFLLSSSVEQTSPDQRRQLRDELGQAVSATRVAGTAFEVQTKLCQEAAAALKQAGPEQKEIVVEKKAERDADFDRLQKTLLEANERLTSLDTRRRAAGAFFTQSEALGFLRSRRYELTPRNLASAIAGSPYVLWRTSLLRCKKVGCEMAESTNYLVLLAVSHILEARRPRSATKAAHLFQNEIPKLPKGYSQAKDFLTQNWPHFKRAVEEHWESCPYPRRLPYDLTTAFLKNLTRPTTALERVLAAQEKLESPNEVQVQLPGITVTELFKAAGLHPHGPVRWGVPVTEKKPGVYVIAIVPRLDDGYGPLKMPFLPAAVAPRWIPSQPVLYIGRTKRPLSRRVDEFYRHVYGRRSPHSGGQAVKLLTCPLWVYWSPTKREAVAEAKMIGRFKKKVGRLPFANRVSSARVKENSN